MSDKKVNRFLLSMVIGTIAFIIIYLIFKKIIGIIPAYIFGYGISREIIKNDIKKR